MSDARHAGTAERKNRHELRLGQMIDSLQIGGAERQVVNLINEMPANGVALITLRDSNDPLAEQVQRGIARVRCVIRWRSLPRDVWRLARQLRALDLDVLQTHMFRANFAGVLAGKLAGIPVIVTTEHGRNERKPRWARWIERYVISKLADKRICVSNDILQLRNMKDGVPREKLCVIPNGTAVHEQELVKHHEPIRIGSLGRFIDAKDFPTLIEAAGFLRDRGVSFQLFIIGDGPDYERIASDVEIKQLQNHVSLPGTSNDPLGWLRTLDIYVLSSVREGQPLSLLEAMSLGLPIVATNVGGIPSTLADGEEALLVKPCDASALAGALAKLAGDLDLRRRLGEAARERLIREFSIAVSLRRHLVVFDAILEAKGY